MKKSKVLNVDTKYLILNEPYANKEAYYTIFWTCNISHLYF